MVDVETPSDAAFTRFLGGCDTRTVVAERPALPAERKVRKSKKAKAEPRFTERQMEIAVAALAVRSRNTNAATAAEKSWTMGTEKPKSYAEEVAPCPHWGDKDITAEKVIRYSLVSAQQEHEAMRLAMRADMKLEHGSDECAAAVHKTMIHTLNYIAQAVTADLMLTIQRLAPDEADNIAAKFIAVGEAGDYWPEVIWEQMTERGIDPERIRTETIAAIAAEKSK